MTTELEKRIYIKTILIALIVIVTSIILGFYKFSTGMAIGTFASILNFKLLAIRTKVITLSKKTPNPFFVIGSLLFRFLIMGSALWIAIQRGLALFVGACVGLFMVILAIYADNFLMRVESRE